MDPAGCDYFDKARIRLQLAEIKIRYKNFKAMWRRIGLLMVGCAVIPENALVSPTSWPWKLQLIW